ncbi:hypothetical protein [Gemmatimonas sp.]
MPAPKPKLLNHTDPRGFEYAVVDLSLLIPDNENPRIAPQADSPSALVELLTLHPEEMLELGKDIIEMGGTSPSELVCVERENGHFVVREGNRRIAARQLLQNPHRIRGRVPDEMYNRWVKLSEHKSVGALPHEFLVVISTEHDPWIDRRHMGSQGGVGVIGWDAIAKRRRALHRTGKKDLVLGLIESLSGEHKDRFGSLAPSRGNVSTFVRLAESTEARARIGLDTDEEGRPVLLHGERSLALLEQILKDLRSGGVKGRPKINTRVLNDATKINEYLDKLEEQVTVPTTPRLTLGSPVATEPRASVESASDPTPAKPAREREVFRRLRVINIPRLRQLHRELMWSADRPAPNAAIVLTRILLELSLDEYLTKRGLLPGSDEDPVARQQAKDFLQAVGRAGLQPLPVIKKALARIGDRSGGLREKLTAALNATTSLPSGMPRKEMQAKLREINQQHIIDTLNDHVHRLLNAPNRQTAEQILLVLEPVFTVLHDTYAE